MRPTSKTDSPWIMERWVLCVCVYLMSHLLTTQRAFYLWRLWNALFRYFATGCFCPCQSIILLMWRAHCLQAAPAQWMNLAGGLKQTVSSERLDTSYRWVWLWTSPLIRLNFLGTALGSENPPSLSPSVGVRHPLQSGGSSQLSFLSSMRNLLHI